MHRQKVEIGGVQLLFAGYSRLVRATCFQGRSVNRAVPVQLKFDGTIQGNRSNADMSIAVTTTRATRRPLTRCIASCPHRRPPMIYRGVATSSSSGSQSSKICTVPFGLKPEDAMTRLHITGLLASGQSMTETRLGSSLIQTGQLSNIVYAGLLRLFGPGVSSYAREFGFGETVTLKGMKAVLYPIWRIDAILEGGVESERTRKEKEAFLAVEEGYVPGTPISPSMTLTDRQATLSPHCHIYHSQSRHWKITCSRTDPRRT